MPTLFKENHYYIFYFRSRSVYPVTLMRHIREATEISRYIHQHVIRDTCITRRQLVHCVLLTITERVLFQV